MTVRGGQAKAAASGGSSHHREREMLG